MGAAHKTDHVAVIGYGYWGSEHVRVLNSMPGVAVSVVDAHEDRLAEAGTRYPDGGLAAESTR